MERSLRPKMDGGIFGRCRLSEAAGWDWPLLSDWLQGQRVG
ncbi:MAG: hypothetical protein ABIE84_02925 [bacterium]